MGVGTNATKRRTSILSVTNTKCMFGPLWTRTRATRVVRSHRWPSTKSPIFRAQRRIARRRRYDATLGRATRASSICASRRSNIGNRERDLRSSDRVHRHRRLRRLRTMASFDRSSSRRRSLRPSRVVGRTLRAGEGGCAQAGPSNMFNDFRILRSFGALFSFIDRSANQR